MAMSGTVLGDAMLAAVDLAMAGLPIDATMAARRTAAFRALGSAIVTHIQTLAVVTTAGTATGVTTGPGTAPTTAAGTVS